MLVIHLILGCAGAVELRSGDIIFEISTSSQAKAVALASRSPIGHVGIIAVRDGAVTVIEAVQPVREVPIEDFKANGLNWTISRLKQPPPNDDWADGVLRVARKWKGKTYDSLFEWSDDKIYCSELVWKAFDRGAGIQLVAPQHIGDLDLFWPPVKALIKARLHGKAPDLEELIVTPGHLHDSELLETIVGWLGH